MSAALLLRDWLSPNRSPKLLEIGTAALFGALALYTLMAHPAWSIMGVRLVVDAGLLLIVVVSIAIRQPFTLQYAREQVPQALWTSREFMHQRCHHGGLGAGVCRAGRGRCGAAHDAGSAAGFGIIATVLALVGAFKFTGWYPNRAAAEAAAR